MTSDELAGAQAWLADTEAKQLLPTDLQRAYIGASARRTRQLRNIRRASIIGSAVAVPATLFAIGATLLGAQAANQLAIVPPTLTAVAQQV